MKNNILDEKIDELIDELGNQFVKIKKCKELHNKYNEYVVKFELIIGEEATEQMFTILDDLIFLETKMAYKTGLVDGISFQQSIKK